MQKLLFFQWHSFMNEGIQRALQKLNIEYDIFFYQFTDWEKDDVFLEKFGEKLKTGKYNKVFSVNFAPLISNICEACSIPYISWVYDSPIHIRNLNPMKNSCNTIYFFDRGQKEEYEKLGINAKHLPLAADVELLTGIIRNNGCKDKYQISLLGQLYQTDYAYYASFLDDYLKGYLEALIHSQMKLYGAYFLPELVTEDLLEKMNTVYQAASMGRFQMEKRELEFLLAQEITGRERYLALALLSKHFSVDVFSTTEDSRLEQVKFHGYADYNTKMPSIFAGSDINLNISLKCIRTGIPLRGIEAMACGGFLLSNYQAELAEYFKVGEECEIYESLEDLYAKAEFYQKEDGLRRKIAQNGQERIRREFNFELRLKEMLCLPFVS